jgi:hypothetical protein
LHACLMLFIFRTRPCVLPLGNVADFVFEAELATSPSRADSDLFRRLNRRRLTFYP